MNKIFLTGATGNIGSGILDILKEQKADFTCGLQGQKTIQGLKSVAFNYDDIEEMAAALKGHDTLFMLAPLSEHMKVWTLNMIEAAKQAGIKHLVRASGYGADINSDYMILREHGHIDQAVMDSGIDYTITRPNTFMQNFVYFYGQTIKDDGMIFLPNDQAKLTYSDVRDVSLANANILLNARDHVNKTYDLLGYPISTNQIAGIFSELLNKEVDYVAVSVDHASKAMLEAGMPVWVVKAIDSLNDFGAKGGSDSQVSDLDKLMNKTITSFKEFVQDYLESWQ